MTMSTKKKSETKTEPKERLTSVYIVGVPFTVIYEDKPRSRKDESVLGLLNLPDQTIKIKKDVSDALCSRILMHEMTHGMLYMIGKYKLGNNEQFVQSFALGLSSVFVPRTDKPINKCPKKVNIFEIPYKVALFDDDDFTDFGYLNFDKQVILIDSKVSSEIHRLALVEQVVCAILESLCYQELSEDTAFTRCIAMAICHTLDFKTEEEMKAK